MSRNIQTAIKSKKCREKDTGVYSISLSTVDWSTWGKMLRISAHLKCRQSPCNTGCRSSSSSSVWFHRYVFNPPPLPPHTFTDSKPGCQGSKLLNTHMLMDQVEDSCVQIDFRFCLETWFVQSSSLMIILHLTGFYAFAIFNLFKATITLLHRFSYCMSLCSFYFSLTSIF